LFAELTQPNDRWGAGTAFGSWTRDGKYFFFRVGRDSGNVRNSGIWVVRESTNLFGRRSAPRQIFMSPLLSGPPVPSPDGKRLFFNAHQEDRELMKFNPHDQRFTSWLRGASVGHLNYSPDGEWVTFVTFTDGVLWRLRSDGTLPLRLAESPAMAFAPVFSPDGTRIAYHDARDIRGSTICVVPRDGGVPLSLTTGDDSAASWFPDGNSILYLHRVVAGNPATDPAGIYRIDLRTRRKDLIPHSQAKSDPILSPDGRYIAAPSEDFLHLKLYSFATQQWTDLATGAFLRNPRWSRDSQFVYFQDYYEGSDQPIYRIRIADGKKEKIATSVQFQRSDVFHGYLFQALAPDGQPLVSMLRNKSDLYSLDLELPK